LTTNEPDAVDRVLSRFSTVLALATAVMVALSFPLWTGTPDFPRVPPLPVDLEGPGWLSWMRAVAVLGGLIALAFRGLCLGGKPLRLLFALVAVLLVWSILADIERFQPWIYQFLLASLAMVALPGLGAAWMCRWIILAIYVFSGLSKLDHSFTEEFGPMFLNAAVRPFGGDPWAWPSLLRSTAILAMPFGELSVGLLLISRKTVRVGLAGATILHLALIGILGPWNLGHSTIVLCWNAAILVEAWMLFAVKIEPMPRPRPREWPAMLVLCVCLVAPVLEPWGLIDPWPAHALYASHVERINLWVNVPLDQLPKSVRPAFREHGEVPSCATDLTGWSRSVRGVPVYPGRWANLHVVSWIVERLGPGFQPRLTIIGRADRWTGLRSTLEYTGFDDIRRAVLTHQH
jgi:hypothetical protein